MLDRVGGEAVAATRPALRAAEREHPGVLARAVVLDRSRFGAALELVLLGRRLGEQAADGGELVGRGEVRRRRDRDLLGRQVVTRPHERAGPETASPRSGARRRARHRPPARRRAVADGDRMHAVRRLDDAAPANDHLDRAHGRQAYATSCHQSSQNTFEQLRLPDSSSAPKEERTLVKRSVARVLLATVAAGLIAAALYAPGATASTKQGCLKRNNNEYGKLPSASRSRAFVLTRPRSRRSRPRTAATAPPGLPGTTRASTMWSRSSRRQAGTSRSTCSTSRSLSRSSSTRRRSRRTHGRRDGQRTRNGERPGDADRHQAGSR